MIQKYFLSTVNLRSLWCAVHHSNTAKINCLFYSGAQKEWILLINVWCRMWKKVDFCKILRGHSPRSIFGSFGNSPSETPSSCPCLTFTTFHSKWPSLSLHKTQNRWAWQSLFYLNLDINTTPLILSLYRYLSFEMISKRWARISGR